MGRTEKGWKEATYGPERARTLKSRLFVLLRDELGLGRQPKVAKLLVDEIAGVVETTLVDAATLHPGQLLALCPEVGQGPSFTWKKLEDKKLKAVHLTLISAEDIERLAGGEPLRSVRKARMVRLVKEAYEQGATLTCCQLAMMTGISPPFVATQLREHMEEAKEVLPLRGIIEDCSPAVSHKTMIIARHLEGQSTTEIAKATDHTPRSVERYIARFEQVRELLRYLDKEPDAAVISRILGCSRRLVQAYLELMPSQEPGSVSHAS